MGLRDWFRRRKATPARDPIEAFDSRIDALAARGAALRTSAAALMASRRTLERKIAQGEVADGDREARTEQALASDPEALAVLQADRAAAVKLKEQWEEEMRRATSEAEAVAEAVRAIETELAKLRLERDAARVRLDASSAVTESAAAFVDPLDQLLDLDAARDEIERARALADIYREEAAASSLADDELPPNRPKSR